MGIFAEGKHEAVAVEDVEQVAALLFLELAKGSAYHEFDACTATVGEEYVASVDTVYIHVKPHGTHEGYFVGDAEGVGATVGDGQLFAGFFENELYDFVIG